MRATYTQLHGLFPLCESISPPHPAGDHEGPPIRINLSPNPGFRRGEGGWVEVVWALMVARGWGKRPVQRRATIPRRPTAGDHQGPPFPTSPPSPLRMLMSFS